jgi:hypothetical protein
VVERVRERKTDDDDESRRRKKKKTEHKTGLQT